jgi:plastocyanin
VRRTAVAIGLGLGVLVGIAAAAFGIASAATQPAAPSARLFVNAKEFSLILSRQTLKPGEARIQLYNGGEDGHDLRLKRVGGTRTLSIRETSPGDVTELRTMLRTGKWKLWCSLPGHAQAGMRATVTVGP